MVCMGNICRSPMAEIVTAHMLKQAGLGREFQVDSAGTYAGHVGAPPDPRALAALARRGYAAGRLKARKVSNQDFLLHDMVLAMDNSNLKELHRKCPPEHGHKLKLFLEFAPEAGALEVPDPYYGSPDGFERVLDLCELGGRALVRSLQLKAV